MSTSLTQSHCCLIYNSHLVLCLERRQERCASGEAMENSLEMNVQAFLFGFLQRLLDFLVSGRLAFRLLLGLWGRVVRLVGLLHFLQFAVNKHQ